MHLEIGRATGVPQSALDHQLPINQVSISRISQRGVSRCGQNTSGSEEPLTLHSRTSTCETSGHERTNWWDKLPRRAKRCQMKNWIDITEFVNSSQLAG